MYCYPHVPLRSLFKKKLLICTHTGYVQQTTSVRNSIIHNDSLVLWFTSHRQPGLPFTLASANTTPIKHNLISALVEHFADKSHLTHMHKKKLLVRSNWAFCDEIGLRWLQSLMTHLECICFITFDLWMNSSPVSMAMCNSHPSLASRKDLFTLTGKVR